MWLPNKLTGDSVTNYIIFVTANHRVPHQPLTPAHNNNYHHHHLNSRRCWSTLLYRNCIVAVVTGLEFLHLSADVVVHGIGAAVRVHVEQYGGRGPGGEGQGCVCLPHGVHFDWVRHRAELWIDAGGRNARLQGLRNCDATEWVPMSYILARSPSGCEINLVSHSFIYLLLLSSDSPYRTAISGAVLKLQEEGKLHILKTRWWKEKRGGGSCRVII